MYCQILETIEDKINYINDYEIHPAIVQRFVDETNKKFSIHLMDKDVKLTIQALKDFFCAIVMQKGKVEMVSAIVDELWHVFIIYTKEYSNFCSPLNQFLHHDPDNLDTWGKEGELLEIEKNKKNDSTMNIYKIACDIENIMLGDTKRVPRIFSIDSMYSFDEAIKYDTVYLNNLYFLSAQN